MLREFLFETVVRFVVVNRCYKLFDACNTNTGYLPVNSQIKFEVRISGDNLKQVHKAAVQHQTFTASSMSVASELPCI